MWWIIVLGLIAWALVGKPSRDIADWLWGNSPAPWETVDAFYYPNKSNLYRDSRAIGLKSVEECRQWVNQQARANGDPQLIAGSYECGVGFLETWQGLRVYRATLR